MLSSRIAYLRKKNLMSQAQLANQLGLTPSALGMYEQGRRVPAMDILVSMSTLFRVSLDYLVTGKEFNHDSENLLYKLPDDCPCKTCYWKKSIGL